MTKAALRNELAAIRLIIGAADGQSTISVLRALKGQIKLLTNRPPVAQLDRASPYEGEGSRRESAQVDQSTSCPCATCTVIPHLTSEADTL